MAKHGLLPRSCCMNLMFTVCFPHTSLSSISSSFVCACADTHVCTNAYEGQRSIWSIGAQVSSTVCFRWGSLIGLALHQVGWASCSVTTRGHLSLPTWGWGNNLKLLYSFFMWVLRSLRIAKANVLLI